MDIYNYDANTGEYLSSSTAEESPLEPGVFLIPAYATELLPPVPGIGQAVKFISGAWAVVDIPQPVPPVPHVPTLAEIAAARKLEIIILLSQIDFKSIRPLREGDAVRVAALENQAVSLRAELASL